MKRTMSARLALRHVIGCKNWFVQFWSGTVLVVLCCFNDQFLQFVSVKMWCSGGGCITFGEMPHTISYRGSCHSYVRWSLFDSSICVFLGSLSWMDAVRRPGRFGSCVNHHLFPPAPHCYLTTAPPQAGCCSIGWFDPPDSVDSALFSLRISSVLFSPVLSIPNCSRCATTMPLSQPWRFLRSTNLSLFVECNDCN